MKRWHLSKENLPNLVIYLTELLNKNNKPLVTIEENRDLRTNQQNERLWGFLYPSIGNHLGYTPDEMHTLMKFKFLRTEQVINGEVVETIKSTARLSVKDMSDYQEKIAIWAGQMGWSDNG